jgi:hypothetical protein
MPEGEITTTAASARQPRFEIRSADDPTYDVDPGRGYVVFAIVMLAIVGALNVIYGIAAISDSEFQVRDATVVISDLKTWGWVLTGLGVLQLAVAFGIHRQSELARWLGIALACGNALVQFMVLPAQPVWGLMVFFVDITIVWGLLQYGGRDRRSLA